MVIIIGEKNYTKIKKGLPQYFTAFDVEKHLGGQVFR